MKGSLCSISGGMYEKRVFNIVKNCVINGERFNTQKMSDLAGSSSKNDITCVYKQENFGIEIKKYNTPDWMQCSIKYNKDWMAVEGKINQECRNIFNNFLKGKELYNGEIPPFMVNPVTHEEWKQIKSETNQWNDSYIDIPCDTIRRLYSEKGCMYIQISDGYGLYHLGQDVCNFGVPIFEIEQHLRIRTKIHIRKNKSGFCSMSITVACKPKNIKTLEPSMYSLDDPDKLPINVFHND